MGVFSIGGKKDIHCGESGTDQSVSLQSVVLILICVALLGKK